MSDEIIKIFSIPIYESHANFENDSRIKNLLYSLKGEHNAVFKSDNSFIGYEDNSKILDDFNLNIIKTKILNNFFRYLKIYGINESIWYIGKSWITITEPGGSIKMHNHIKHGAIFSGVLYIDVNPMSGDLIFLNPYPFRDRLPFVEKNALNDPYIRFPPEKKKILIWPSSLNHGTDVNMSDRLRLSIAFDFHYIDQSAIPPKNLLEKIIHGT